MGDVIYDLCAEDTGARLLSNKQKIKRNGENVESQATSCFSSNPELVADGAHQTWTQVLERPLAHELRGPSIVGCALYSSLARRWLVKRGFSCRELWRVSVSVRLNHDLLKCVRWPKEPPVCGLDGHKIQRKTRVPLARTSWSCKVFKNHVVWISFSLQSASCLEGRLLRRALCAFAPLPLPGCPQLTREMLLNELP